jgi:PPOX class probable F420-dependent enzyme
VAILVVVVAPGKHALSRLKKELVIWLVTTGRDRRPQAVPVWFLWDGTSFLIYAVPGLKVRHVKANPYVELHLNSDAVGGDVVRASGYATIPKSQPAAHSVPAYVRKYRDHIEGLGMTVESFAEQYRYPIRVRRLRFR